MGERLGGHSPLEEKGACDRCAGLCCMAPSFEAGQGFGVDKPNATACPNLKANDRCGIHGHRETEGFTSCVTYDCGGVGQYVSETVFAGADWRTDPALQRDIASAFLTVKRIADVAELLEAAGGLQLDGSDQDTRNELLSRLWPDGGWTPDRLRRFSQDGAIEESQRFLRSLSRYFSTQSSAQGDRLRRR